MIKDLKEIVDVEEVRYSLKRGGYVEGVRIYISCVLCPPFSGRAVISEFIKGGKIEDYPKGPILAVLYEPSFAGYACKGVIYV